MSRHNTSWFLIVLLVFYLTVFSGCIFRNNSKFQKVQQLLESGNKAFEAKQYDEAIRYYDAGLTIVPDELALLTNKSTALLLRGTSRFNASIKLTDGNAKSAEREKVKKDLQLSEDIAVKAIDLIKSSHPVPFLDYSYEREKTHAYSTRFEALRIRATIFDRTQADEALSAMQEYIEIELDKEKKLAAQLNAGKMLIETFNGELAITEYRKVLADDPNNIEALLGTGLALAQSGNKHQMKESKQYLQRFVNQAPANHPQIAIAKDILNSTE